jgi:hypothetical protein
MRPLLCILILLGCLPAFSQNKVILQGSYQGKNLYIQNPYSTDGFCTEKVLVNGKEVKTELASTAYVIPLDSMGFKLDDTLYVEIFHKNDCKPKVLADYTPPRLSFEVTSIWADSTGTIHWISAHESGKLTFIVEQFRWNKWIKIGEVNGEGTPGKHLYSFEFTSPHSGLNKFRVKQAVGNKTKTSRSAELLFPDQKLEIIGNRHKLSEAVEFTSKTMYELYDRDGNIVKRGSSTSVGLKDLKRGTYFLNYDNKTEEITKFY